MDGLREAVQLLSQIEQDYTVPKNIRLRIKTTISVLSDEKDMAIKIDKSLQELDDVSDDPNVPSYTRTLIWNVVSLLESRK